MNSAAEWDHVRLEVIISDKKLISNDIPQFANTEETCPGDERLERFGHVVQPTTFQILAMQPAQCFEHALINDNDKELITDFFYQKKLFKKMKKWRVGKNFFFEKFKIS